MGHNYLRRISSRFTLVGFLAPIKPLKRDTRLLYSIPTNSRPMDKGLAPGAGWGANSSRALYQDPTLQISNLVAFAGLKVAGGDLLDGAAGMFYIF